MFKAVSQRRQTKHRSPPFTFQAGNSGRSALVQRAQHEAGFTEAYTLDFFEAYARQALVVYGVFDRNVNRNSHISPTPDTRHPPGVNHVGDDGQRADFFERVVKVAVARDPHARCARQAKRPRIQPHGVALNHR